MRFLDQEINPLGMGCWPIGGPIFSGDQPLGYANSDDAESIRTIHAALAGGVTLFDTAPAYGAGHAERLLAQALKNRPDALIVNKIGIAIDEETRQLTGDEIVPESVLPAIDRSLSRLGRDRIDLLLLHQNGLPIPHAEAMFDEMEKAVKAGKVRAYGWSTDFAESVSTAASRDAFVAVEHAMNVLVSPPRIQAAIRESE
ncbi:MAG: aldo/keto reductase [Roseibium sp.]|nr:aldo/keto reductase [Roseibium sp.]